MHPALTRAIVRTAGAGGQFQLAAAAVYSISRTWSSSSSSSSSLSSSSTAPAAEEAGAETGAEASIAALSSPRQAPTRKKTQSKRPDHDPLRARLSAIIAQGRSTEKRLSINIDNSFISLDYLHIRDACTCPICVDPSTKQKLFQTQDIPMNIRVCDIQTNSLDGSITVTWSSEFMGRGHVSQYTSDQLRLLASHRASIRSRYDDMNYVLWDRALMEKDIQFVPYKDYMENDEILLFTLQQLVTYGLVFLKDVPSNPESVAQIAERVGNIKQTFYGRTWDVKSIPNSKNIAYTPLNLGLHMDLLYYESPPGLQFLHTLSNTVTGGSSYFADSFRAAEVIRINSPNAFTSLLTFPVNFHYNNDNQHYFYTRPTIVLSSNSYQNRKRIDHVNYAPPFQAPFDVPDFTESSGAVGQWRQYFHAMSMFGNLIKRKENQFELRMKEGECAIFQNRRVLHARREFDPDSGERWLKGTYVDGDAYRSRLRVLMEKYKKKADTLGTDVKYSYIR